MRKYMKLPHEEAICSNEKMKRATLPTHIQIRHFPHKTHQNTEKLRAEHEKEIWRY